ncbi:hypothetical protein GCM10009114_36140 [Aliiglaciecola litoralis]|uniref:Uncharacterized protein n=1 Tax=Aliiglaciecola litoralis TaxID=582857 RepID=A0ABN1LTF7_9ALTE
MSDLSALLGNYLKPVIAQKTSTIAINEMQDVHIPTFFERIQPLIATLANSINIPKENPKILTTLAVLIPSSLYTLLGVPGCKTELIITKLITATIKQHAEIAVEPTTQLVIRFEESATNKVTKNVAEKPPKKADKNAN